MLISRSVKFLVCFSLLLSTQMSFGNVNRHPRVTCDIWDDPQGIPHAKAPNETEAFACIGYLHWRDRAWQMDWMRRLVQGKTAEVLGTLGIVSDFTLRLFNLDNRAK